MDPTQAIAFAAVIVSLGGLVYTVANLRQKAEATEIVRIRSELKDCIVKCESERISHTAACDTLIKQNTGLLLEISKMATRRDRKNGWS